MSNLHADCPSCGTEPGTGENANRAFVRYLPQPNDAQARQDWTDDLPELRGIACTECGYVLGVIDVRDADDLPDPTDTTASNDYRIQGELE